MATKRTCLDALRRRPSFMGRPLHIQPAPTVPLEAVHSCLETVERRDPLAIPVDFSEPDRQGAWVAVCQGAVIGVAWLRTLAGGQRVEIRVVPGRRRDGIGGALFERLSPTGPLLASCDAAQLNVRRFLESRRFEPMGVIFVQRWDGEASDVPRAFDNAHIADADDRALAARVLEDASADSWPPPLFDSATLSDRTLRVRLAWRDDRPVGICAARRGPGAWTIGGLAVLPDARGAGIGRQLLCELMRRAADDGDGIVLRVSHTDERVLRWTGQLGFWTCRSWISYRRASGASDRRAQG